MTLKRIRFKRMLMFCSLFLLLSSALCACGDKKANGDVTKETQETKEEKKLPKATEIRAALKEGVQYSEGDVINLDDFIFTLIFDDGTEKEISSGIVSDHADVSLEAGEVVVNFTYTFTNDDIAQILGADNTQAETTAASE